MFQQKIRRRRIAYAESNLEHQIHLRQGQLRCLQLGKRVFRLQMIPQGYAQRVNEMIVRPALAGYLHGIDHRHLMQGTQHRLQLGGMRTGAQRLRCHTPNLRVFGF